MAPAAPLSELRVVELEPCVAARFAGRWLAALGAEVVQIAAERSERARRETPARALYLDAGKRFELLDPANPAEAAQLSRLVSESGMLLASAGPGALARRGLDLDALRQADPALVSVCVTPFGEVGPYAELPASSLTLSALSGMMWHVGAPGRAPLCQWGDQPEHLGGLHTLGAALCGWYAARTSGRGQHLDVSLLACCAAVVGHHTARVSQGGDAGGRRTPRALWRLYPTADGWAGISALGRNYAGLAKAMGLPEIERASPFLDHEKRPEEEARLTRSLEDWFGGRRCAEVSELALRERVPLSSVLSIEQVAQSQQLAERGFFADVEPPQAAGALRMPSRLWSSEGLRWNASGAQAGARPPAARAPAPPTSVEPAGPLLSGLRVLDLGQVWAGPYASMLLAEQGADVIRVESPTAWDPNRVAAPAAGARDADWWNTCPYYHEYNHSKRSLGLDLRSERGRELFARLVAKSDLVIENLRVDTLERLGIGYEWLRAQRSDVILVSMTAFGRTGPESVLPGYGPMIEQLSGMAGLTAYGEDEPPQLAQGYAYGDPVAAVAAASAALVALIQRRQTGAGQHVDLAQREVTTALLGEAFGIWSTSGQAPPRQGNGRRGCAPHGVFRCLGDDEWVAIAVTEDGHWDALCRALESPAWSRDPQLAHGESRYARRAELEERLSAWTSGLRKTEVFERCRTQGVPCGPVWKMPELLEDPQLRALRFYEWTSHPAVGRWRSHGWVWRPAGAGDCLRRPAPDFGGDNQEVLAELLSLSASQIQALERDGVVAREPRGLPQLPSV